MLPVRRQNETPFLSGSLKASADETLFLELARRCYNLSVYEKKKI